MIILQYLFIMVSQEIIAPLKTHSFKASLGTFFITPDDLFTATVTEEGEFRYLNNISFPDPKFAIINGITLKVHKQIFDQYYGRIGKLKDIYPKAPDICLARPVYNSDDDSGVPIHCDCMFLLKTRSLDQKGNTLTTEVLDKDLVKSCLSTILKDLKLSELKTAKDKLTKFYSLPREEQDFMAMMLTAVGEAPAKYQGTDDFKLIYKVIDNRFDMAKKDDNPTFTKWDIALDERQFSPFFMRANPPKPPILNWVNHIMNGDNRTANNKIATAIDAYVEYSNGNHKITNNGQEIKDGTDRIIHFKTPKAYIDELVSNGLSSDDPKVKKFASDASVEIADFKEKFYKLSKEITSYRNEISKLDGQIKKLTAKKRSKKEENTLKNYQTKLATLKKELTKKETERKNTQTSLDSKREDVLEWEAKLKPAYLGTKLENLEFETGSSKEHVFFTAASSYNYRLSGSYEVDPPEDRKIENGKFGECK